MAEPILSSISPPSPVLSLQSGGGEVGIEFNNMLSGNRKITCTAGIAPVSSRLYVQTVAVECSDVSKRPARKPLGARVQGCQANHAEQRMHGQDLPFHQFALPVEFDTTPAQVLSDPGTYSLTVRVCTDE